jgi:MscS family membrane protein
MLSLQNLLDNSISDYLWYLLISITFITLYYFARVIIFTALYTFKNNKKYEVLISKLNSPISLFATFLIMYASKISLKLSPEVFSFFKHFKILILIFAFMLLALTLSSYALLELREKLIKNNKTSLAATIPLFSKILKSIIVIFGVLYALKTLGFNVNTIIATLGVGGLAIALASQKTVENLFGGVVLAMDQPIRVGDIGKFGNFIGVVEDLGLRSTTIQTINRTSVTIPNSSLSSDVIENLSARDKISFSQSILINYETSSEDLLKAINKIESLLKANEKVEKETSRAKLVKFETNGFNIEVFAYILTTDLLNFLSIQQEIMLQVNNIVQENTKGFAQSKK